MLKTCKKILAIFLIIITVFSLSACGKSNTFSGLLNSSEISQGKEQNSSTFAPKLYKVTNKSGNTIWLFGSIHIGKSNFFPLPEYVTSALYSSDAVAVEFDLVAFEKDVAAQTQSMTKLISPNYSVKSHLTQSETSIYDQAVEILKENNSYNSAFDYYKPVVWSMLIDNFTYEKFGADSSLGIDKHILDTAKEKNIKIEEIESADSQYQMLADFSDELQTKMLVDSIKNYNNPNAKKEIEELMETWSTGNHAKLRQILKEDEENLKKELPNHYFEYTYAMTTKRDALMTQYAIDALAKGNETFICVGAAHIAGENGMVDSLKAEGYNVEEIQ